MAGDPKLGAEYARALRHYAATLTQLADRVDDPDHDRYCRQGLIVGQAAAAVDKTRRPWNATIPTDYPREGNRDG